MSDEKDLEIEPIKNLKGGRLVVRRKPLDQLSEESLTEYPATLIDVFDLLPLPLQEKFFNEDVLTKSVNSVFPKPTKKRKQVSFDRSEVHKIAMELDQQYPNMTTSEMAEHPKIAEIAMMYSDRTVLKWIREVVTRPRGRPKKEIDENK